MANFNPQFSVTQARADYSPLYRGLASAGQSIGDSLQMFMAQREQKKQEEEMAKQMESVADFLGKAPEKYADKKTGFIDTGKALRDPALKGLDPSFIKAATDQIGDMNSMIEKRNLELDRQRDDERMAKEAGLKQDTETAAATYAMDPSRTPIDFLKMDPGAVQQGYTQGQKKRLDMQNTQSEIDKRGRPDAPSAADADILRYMQANPNASWTDAYNAVNTKTVADPGGTGIYRVGPDGKAEKLEVNKHTPPSKDQLLSEEFYGSPSLKLYDRVTQEMTGLVPAAKDVAQKFLAGPINSITGSELSVIPPEVQQTMQEFLSVQRSLVKSLQENPRYPEGERKSIAEEVNITPSAFKDEQTLKAYIRGVNEFLNRRLETAIRIRDDETRDMGVRADAGAMAENIAFTLFQLGVGGDEPKTKDMTDEELVEFYSR